MNAALAVTATLAGLIASVAAQTAPQLCKADSDCNSPLACSSAGFCAASTITVPKKINCTISTLDQCGDDWATRLQQPLILGLVIGGALLVLVLLPGLIFCFIRKTLCFAVRGAGKVASSAVKALGPSKTDRSKPPTNSMIQDNRNRIYGNLDDSEFEVRGRNGPAPVAATFKGAQKLQLNDDIEEEERRPAASNPYPQRGNPNRTRHSSYGAPAQNPQQMYPPTPAAAANAYGYPTQAAPVAAFNNINNRPQPNAINQPPQQQFNQYGAPMVIGYNNNPQISTQPQRAQIYPPAAPQPSPAQFNPQYRQPFNPQQQQQQYPQPQQLQLPPPTASNLQGLLNQTRLPAPTNHDQDSPLNSEDLTYTDPSTSSPPKSLNPLTAALGSMNPTNSARTLASSNASRAILPPPPQHSPSPMLIAQSQQQQEQQFQERRPRAAHPFASTEPSKRPPRGASAAKPIEPEISSQFAPTVATEEEDDDHDFLESYLDRPADDDNDDAQYAPEEEEEYASSLASSSDDSLLRAPQPVNLLVGRDHTVRRGVDPRTVGLGAPVRRLSGDERKKQYEELHLMNQKRLSREVGSGGVGGGMDEFVKSGGVLFPRTSAENGRPRGRDLNEDEDEGGRRPRRTSAGREDGGGRSGRVSGDTRNQYDLEQQDQETRPRARTSAPRNDVQQQGFTPRARSSSGARNTEPQSQLSPSTDGYTPRPRQQSSEATTPQQQGQPMRRARSSDNQTTNSTTPDNASRQPPTRPSNEPATRKRFSKDFASADLGDGFALRSITAAKRASRELTQPVALARERAAKRASLTFDAGSSSGSDNSRRGSKERYNEDGRSAVASKLTEEYASTRWDDLDRGRSGKEGAEGAVGKLEVVEKVVVEDPYHGYGSARAYYKAKYLNNAGGGVAAGTSAVTSPVVQEEPVPSVTATSRGAARSRSQARPV